MKAAGLKGPEEQFADIKGFYEDLRANIELY